MFGSMSLQVYSFKDKYFAMYVELKDIFLVHYIADSKLTLGALNGPAAILEAFPFPV